VNTPKTKRSAHTPNLALVMREVYEFWTGAPVADAALREYRALLAVARAAAKHMDATHYPPGASDDATTDHLWACLQRLARASRTEGGRP
jgi:hypothetical protein